MHTWGRALRAPWLHFLIFLLLSLWVTRPLVWRLESGIPVGTSPEPQQNIQFRPGDSQQLLFYNWLFVDSVQSGRHPLSDPYEFGPLVPEDMHLLGLWGFPMQLLFGLLSVFGWVTAYNLVVLLSFPITAVVAELALRALGAGALGAWCGGLFYGFCLYRKTQMFCGHANGFLFFHLPLLVWLTHRMVARRSYAHAVGAGAVLFGIAMGEWHQFYYTTLFIAPYGLFLLLRRERVTLRGFGALLRRWGGLVATPAIFGAAGLGVLRLVHSFGLEHSPASERGLDAAQKHVPVVGRFFSPTFQFTRDVVFAGEVERRPMYLGLSVLLLLLVIGAAGLWRQRRGHAPLWRRPLAQEPYAPHWRAMWVTFVVSLVLMLSPALSVVYRGVAAVLPYWELSRVTGRIFYITAFAWAAILAFQITRLRTQLAAPRPAIQRLLGIWVLVFVTDVVVANPPVLLTGGPQTQSAILQRLAGLSARQSGPLLILPVTSPEMSSGSQAERLAMTLRKPMLNGYSPAAPRRTFQTLQRLYQLNGGEVPGAALEVLQRYRVQYVMFDKHVRFWRRPPAWRQGAVRALADSEHFALVAEDNAYALLQLVQ